jgi:hypothetical protein
MWLFDQESKHEAVVEYRKCEASRTIPQMLRAVIAYPKKQRLIEITDLLFGLEIEHLYAEKLSLLIRYGLPGKTTI